MKKIGILCATAKEVYPYLSTIEIKKASEYAMRCFCNGLITGTEVVAVYSGCGKINASITAQILIDRYQVDAVIFSGIAGGMKKEIEVFDTVVCTASVFHDTDNEIYMGFPVKDEPIFYAEPIHSDALCIDMETAAAAHTCYLNKVPFVAIRSISDNNKESGQEAINRNYEKAAYQSYQFVYAMLHELEKENACASGEDGK